MHKAAKEIKELLPKIDIIIEVLDARIPYSSENPMIADLRGNIPSIKLLSKSDLANPDMTQQWIAYFEKQSTIKAIAVSTEQPEKIRQISRLCKSMLPGKEDKAGNINVLIMGIPNVGKSTIINTLAGKAITKTGNEPAVTKGQQKINLHNGIMLWDTPGMLWPKVHNENSAYRLATTGAIKETAISHDDIAFFAADYLLKTEPQLLKNRYQLDELPHTEIEFLELIGMKNGCLGKGGRVDLDKISKRFLTDIQDAIIGRLTFETPAIAEREKIIVAEKIKRIEEEKDAKKSSPKKNRRRR